MNWIEKLFSYFRFQGPPPTPRRVNKIPPDEERCTSPTDKGDRCKFRRAAGKERCSIHQKMYDKAAIP